MLQMAIEAIERGGEASVRVREVSDATGVSFASLYHFFGSREGLVEEALAEMYVRSIREANVGFGATITGAQDADAFYDAIRTISLAVYDPERSGFRFTRLSVLGSTAGRPNLARRVAEVQIQASEAMAELMRRPQERGWIHPSVDRFTFASWLTGLVLGRAIIELEPTKADPTAWNEMSIAAIIHIGKTGIATP
jgi:AcrR family transcriptional regulator